MNLKQTTEENDHHIRELKQKINILLELDKDFNDKVDKLQECNKQLKEKLHSKSHNSKEREQEKIFLDEISKTEISKTQAISKKYYLTIALAGIVLVAVIVPYSLYVITLVGEEYRIQDTGSVTSGYVIQNLRGDTIDTWISWRLAEGEPLHVSIINSAKLSEENLEIVKNAILSTETIEIDNLFLHKGPRGTTSIFYLGWAGALESAAKSETKSVIPTKFEFVESSGGVGDILITLTSLKDTDGYSGYTESLADDSQNQILKSNITVLDCMMVPKKARSLVRSRD